MTSGLSDRFAHYLPPTRDAVQKAITLGLVVLDTNVLLSAYRFAPAARGELLSAMERLGSRLWIPDQVAREFHRNRLDVIVAQDAAYQQVLDSISEHQRTIRTEVTDKIRALANRVALSEEESKRLEKLVSGCLDTARINVETLRSKHGPKELASSDSILERLNTIFAGKVGAPLKEDERIRFAEEAKRRKGAQEPPGYEDSDSTGDYLVWAQTLIEAAKRHHGWLMFITNDAKKDWYRVIKGRTISARPELIEEAYTVANTRLVMQNVRSFLYHAREHLDVTISMETLQQAEAVPRETGRRQGAIAELTRLTAELVHTEMQLAIIDDEIQEIHEAMKVATAEFFDVVDDPHRRDHAKDLHHERNRLHAELSRQLKFRQYRRAELAMLRQRIEDSQKGTKVPQAGGGR
jgi:rRNA-processing protein FCF1